MKTLTDTYVMNNGVKIPCIGYGTFQIPNNDTERAVEDALKAGYRHIDTAYFYGNERGVGEAVRKSGIPREQIFVTSKVWNADRGYDTTKAEFEKTMENLGLEYLDLYLIHWPANRNQFGDEAKRINAETWRAMEELYREGRIRAIGLSNFMPHHIEELLETATIKPMVDQIEFHPGWAQLEVSEYCHKNGIIVEAWSPFGRKDVLGNETLKNIAEKYGKNTAQICVRWAMQHNILPLPRTINRERMVENVDVFDFVIDEQDMKCIDGLKNLGGQCAIPDEVYEM